MAEKIIDKKYWMLFCSSSFDSNFETECKLFTQHIVLFFEYNCIYVFEKKMGIASSSFLLRATIVFYISKERSWVV